MELASFPTWLVLAGDLEPLSFIDWDTIVNDAAAEFQPVAESFSLANDLLEFEEIKSMALKFRGLGDSLRKFERSSPSFRRSSDDTVNSFLAWNFGVVPLVADCKAAAHALKSVIARLRFLRKSFGREIKLVHRWTHVMAPETPDFFGSDPNQYVFRTVMTSGKYSGTIGMSLVHRLNGLDEFDGQLRALAAFFGLNKPFKIAWNAIPYSFLIDWCYDVGGFLDRMAIPVFSGQYDLHSPWWTLKFEGTYTRYGRILPQYGNSDRIEDVVSCRKFVRLPGLPPVPFRLHSWSWFQAQLFGALSWQYLPHGHK